MKKRRNNKKKVPRSKGVCSDAFEDVPDIDFDTFEFPPRPECPICMVTLPLGSEDHKFRSCCGMMICIACAAGANDVGSKRGLSQTERLRCPFCRQKAPGTPQENLDLLHARAEKGDGLATTQIAYKYLDGEGVPQDMQKYLYHLHKAARAGSADAALRLGLHYINGDIVKKDRAVARRVLTKAITLGSVPALTRLASIDMQDERDLYERKFLLAASAGDQLALDWVKMGYQSNIVSKLEFANTLRSFQAVQEDVKSEGRDKYAEMMGGTSKLAHQLSKMILFS